MLRFHVYTLLGLQWAVLQEAIHTQCVCSIEKSTD